MSVTHGVRAQGARRWVLPLLLLAVALGLPTWPVAAEEVSPVEAAPGAGLTRLEAIRADLVQLRFENALASIEALLGETDLEEDVRSAALVLRAQAHAAFGDLKATEEDYRQILARMPGYTPDPSATPRKALERFEKIRQQLVGRLRVELQPPQARLLVDDRPVVLEADGQLPLLAGEHRLRAELAGFDTLEQTAVVAADGLNGVTLRLVPNARSVVLRTDPAGVEVYLGDVRVGETGAGEDGVGELLLEHLPLQEHRFELRKKCHRTERLRDTLTVDLLDFSPKRYQVVRLLPSQAELAVAGEPAGATLLIDGEVQGRTAQEALTICPGERVIEIRGVDRLLWRERRLVQEGDVLRLTVTPRPNAVVLGAAALPPRFADAYNLLETLPLPASGELSAPEAWRRLDLPRDTDLALGLLPGQPRDRWLFYSPILDAVTEPVEPLALRPVNWTVAEWGLTVVDAAALGRAVVVSSPSGGPAAEIGIVAGDRILTLGGREVGDAAGVRATLAAASVAHPLEIAWLGRSATPEQERKAALQGRLGPRLFVEDASDLEAFDLAARARVDSLAGGDHGATALANLALVLSRHGRHEQALESWRGVPWEERRGVGAGTVLYYSGCALEALGREREAVEAYTQALQSEATAERDDGPRVAPAAADRLSDLGIAVNEGFR